MDGGGLGATLTDLVLIALKAVLSRAKLGAGGDPVALCGQLHGGVLAVDDRQIQTVAVIGAKELLRFPLDAILDADSWARLVRYLLIVIVGGVLWPMTFHWFQKLGKRENG